MTLFEVRSVTKIYAGSSVPANDNISLDIEAGEIFGLLGDNGAGKSTLIKQLVNLVQPTSGEIRFRGRAVAEQPQEVAVHVGYMPQDAAAFNQMTAGEVLFFSGHLRGLGWAEAGQERDRLLALWQIEDLASRTMPKLSGGQRRLVQLAAAMAGSPTVLMLDEPTNELDPVRRRQVWENLRQLNRTLGTTIVFITHDAVEAEKIIQRVGILRRGSLSALGRPTELKKQISHRVRLELRFDPARPPRLPELLRPTKVEPGQWTVYVERDDVEQALHDLPMDRLDDFSLHSPTLEDLYLLHYDRDT